MTSVTPDLSPQRATFAAEFVMLGDGAKAARAAGYAHPKQSAYKLLQNPAVVAHIDHLRTRSTLKTGYTIQQWLEDVQETTREARNAGSWSAAMKGMELVGRHIGALNTERGLTRDGAELFTYLGAQMEKFKHEQAAAVTHPNTHEGTARILE